MAPPRVDSEYREQIKSARKQLDKLISDDKKHNAPLMLHLALHDAGIYGLIRNYLIKGGPNGSIRTEDELNHPSNNGLKKAVDDCEKVKKNYDKITYADLYQLAGVAAVQQTGGPSIEFVPGREDSTESLEEGRLKDESTLEGIRKRMGLEEKDMVALFGGLHRWSLPDGSQADNEPELKFDNSYFKGLEDREPDNLLLKGGFSKWVDTYAKNNTAFRNDYAAAHKKVSELGMSEATSSGQGGGKQTDRNTSVPSATSWNRVRLVQGIGIAVATTAIILGFFLSRRSKSS
ncbi:hypothetical protein K1719_019275 [Acacia pycnantha]|nr:hypothetical protein K1719_019275 [Acacia pycnantha]